MSSFAKLIFSLLILISFELHASLAQSTLSANTENLFSQQENQWLDEHKTLTVGLTEGWPPMSSSNDKSQPQGIDVDIIQLLNSRLGNRLNIEIDEWSKIYTHIKEKKIDLVMGTVALKSREPFLNFTSPYMDIPLVIVARKNSTEFIQTEKNLSGKVIAIERGYSTIDHFQNNYPDVKIKLYDTSLEALEAVSCGDTDDLKQIKTALQAGDSESIKIIQKLSPSLISLFGKKPVNTLIDFIKDYEFEKAYELLLTLLEEKNNV